jgi:hypothetical protein
MADDGIVTAWHPAHMTAKGLGVFSIVLGAAELFWPRAFTDFLGLDGYEVLIQIYGAREIATGIGILLVTRRALWVWLRLGGDALDIATVLYALLLPGAPVTNIVIALLLLAGITLLDIWCAYTLSDQQAAARRSSLYSDRSGIPKGRTGDDAAMRR